MYSRAFAATLAVLAAGQADAAIVEYDLKISRIQIMLCSSMVHGCWTPRAYRAHYGFDFWIPEWMRERDSEDYRIIIDESLIGRSIANWRAEFYFDPACSGEPGCFSSATGIIGGLGAGVAGTWLTMEFGPAREVRDFSYSVWDGPPDWGVGYQEKDGRRGGGFSWYGEGDYYRWSGDVTMRLVSIDGVPVGGPAPVSLPAPLALLGVALGGLALLGRRPG